MSNVSNYGSLTSTSDASYPARRSGTHLSSSDAPSEMLFEAFLSWTPTIETATPLASSSAAPSEDIVVENDKAQNEQDSVTQETAEKPDEEDSSQDIDTSVMTWTCTLTCAPDPHTTEASRPDEELLVDSKKDVDPLTSQAIASASTVQATPEAPLATQAEITTDTTAPQEIVADQAILEPIERLAPIDPKLPSAVPLPTQANANGKLNRDQRVRNTSETAANNQTGVQKVERPTATDIHQKVEKQSKPEDHPLLESGTESVQQAGWRDDEGPSKTKRAIQLEKNRDRNDANVNEGIKEVPSVESAISDSATNSSTLPEGLQPSAPQVVNTPSSVTAALPFATPTAASATNLDAPKKSEALGTSSLDASKSTTSLSPSIGNPITRAYGRATGTERSSGSGTLTPHQETRLVQRVMRGFEQLASGDGQVKLRLHPPQLGSLQMTLRMDGNQMSARLEVENALAQDALTQNLPKLKERLAEQGIQVETFEIQIAPTSDTANSQGSHDSYVGTGLGQADQGSSQEQQERRRNHRWDTQNNNTHIADKEDAPRTSAPIRRMQTGRSIDLTV
ncbi:MAG: flagellar hook-length control protein FliK [Pirellulales bacterium]